MPSLSSYHETLKAQLEPPLKAELKNVVENFDEEVKKVNSPARKILAIFVSSIAAFQLAKKSAEDGLLAALHIERMLEKSRHENSTYVRPATLDDDEEILENPITAHNAVAILTKRIDELYTEKNALTEEFNQNMEQVNVLEKDAVNEVIVKNLGAPMTEKETAEIMNIYKNKPVSEESIFRQLMKAITPTTLKPTPGNQKKEDIDTKEQTQERAYSTKRLKEGLTRERVAQSSSLNDQIKTIGRLREVAPNAPLNSILKTGNAIDGSMNTFQSIRTKLTTAYKETFDILDNKLKGCQDTLSRIKDMLANPFTAAAVNQATPSMKPVPPRSAPDPESESTTPTPKPR